MKGSLIAAYINDYSIFFTFNKESQDICQEMDTGSNSSLTKLLLTTCLFPKLKSVPQTEVCCQEHLQCFFTNFRRFSVFYISHIIVVSKLISSRKIEVARKCYCQN